MPIQITASAGKPSAANVDLVIFPLAAGSRLGTSLPPGIRRAMNSQLRSLKFIGEWGAAELFVAPRGMKASFVAVVGLGEAKDDLDTRAEALRRGLGKILQDARKHVLRTAALSLLDVEEAVSLSAAAVEAGEITNYRFMEYTDRLRQQQEARSLRKLILLVYRSEIRNVRQAVNEAQVVLEGVALTRDLVNQPAAIMSPAMLVKTAEKVAKRSRRISLEIMDKEAAASAGFSAFLAVARGSEEQPYVIHLTYTPAGISAKPGSEPVKKIFLVGKGITFDSGGLSIKTADGMETMKIDMAGAATVLGIFAILPRLQPAVEVHGVIAACENMPSGTAYRPGDILKAKNGKTIEVINTDAEGRITLADALSFAAEHKPDAIIDLATLTGACMVALGETHAGLWSTADWLRDSLLAAAKTAGEGLVPFPLPEEYKPTIESKVADVRNSASTRWGGAITAALFLREFVGETDWAHIDLAGPVYNEQTSLPYFAHGATGYGVRTLAEFLQKF